MDLSRNIQMDLLYLTNDRARRRVASLENGVNKEDLKFYRKRILQQTKNYLREGRLESSIDRAFDNYADKLMEYYKFIDKKEIIQKEYENMEENSSIDVKDIDLLEENKKDDERSRTTSKNNKRFYNCSSGKTKKETYNSKIKRI